MERLKNENSAEKEKGGSIVLDKERVGSAFWGKNVEVAASELIKIFSIIKHIKEKGFTMGGEVELVASDLLEELNVNILKYKNIFTPQVVNQILKSPKIDSVSLDFNEELLTAEAGSTVESMVKDWESKQEFNSPETIERRAIKEKSREKAADQEQSILNEMLIELETIDFFNQEKLVDWLCKYYSRYRNDVNMHEDKVVGKFIIHGYTTMDNDAISGMLGETLIDKERLGKVIIGYLLANGALALQRNSWFKNKIEDWKKF